MKTFHSLLAACIVFIAMTACSRSYVKPDARIEEVPFTQVHLRDSFWSPRIETNRKVSIPSAFRECEKNGRFDNFAIAGGLKEGEHRGDFSFDDTDPYKIIEGASYSLAVKYDKELDAYLDSVITLIAAAQEPDGYLTTCVTNKCYRLSGWWGRHRWEKLNSHELYNSGHLYEAAVAHYQATGKRTLLDVAIKNADLVCRVFGPGEGQKHVPSGHPIIEMALVKLYKVTGDVKYLAEAKHFLYETGRGRDGHALSEYSQDHKPIAEQDEIVGHAVRANYLYAGVADVYAETGEAQLMKNLTSIWNDIVNRKMYVTGACGALYDGTSPDGTCYEPDSIQKVHQSYGRAYQLPNSTAHNETCANIGNMLFNWRMLESTGDAKYADIVETALYNSVLSGVSLDGKRYFYTNPLRLSDDFPYTLRWPRERQEYISCFCCPPNTLRTICEAQNYAYTVSENALWCNLYGQSELTTKLGKHDLEVSQVTGYPYDGKVMLTFRAVPKKQEMALHLRIPAWCDRATVKVNGEVVDVPVKANTYATLNRVWKKGDVVELDMEMRVKLMESNPLVEETRNQVVVKRGPLVYCLEGMDVADGRRIDDVLIPSTIQFTPTEITIDGSKMIALDGEARLMDEASWDNVLYREVGKADRTVKIRLIPYFAWGNRGKSEMTVWMPLAK